MKDDNREWIDDDVFMSRPPEISGIEDKMIAWCEENIKQAVQDSYSRAFHILGNDDDRITIITLYSAFPDSDDVRHIKTDIAGCFLEAYGDEHQKNRHIIKGIFDEFAKQVISGFDAIDKGEEK